MPNEPPRRRFSGRIRPTEEQRRQAEALPRFCRSTRPASGVPRGWWTHWTLAPLGVYRAGWRALSANVEEWPAPSPDIVWAHFEPFDDEPALGQVFRNWLAHNPPPTRTVQEEAADWLQGPEGREAIRQHAAEERRAMEELERGVGRIVYERDVERTESLDGVSFQAGPVRMIRMDDPGPPAPGAPEAFREFMEWLGEAHGEMIANHHAQLLQGGDVPVGEQLDLIPERMPVAAFERVMLTDLPPVTEAPNPDFTQNIQRLGVVLPVALVQREQPEHGSHYIIADGRRRVAACRRLERATVPAMIFPPGTPLAYAAAITLSTNLQRRVNPISELEAIESLMQAGRTEEEVAEALRISVTTLRSRLRMASLAEYLREQVRVGALSVTAAALAARLPRGQQNQIRQGLQRGERWTPDRIRSTFLPAEAPEQNRLPLPGNGVNVSSVTGWAEIHRALGLCLNALPTGEGMEGEEILAIGEKFNELLDMVTPFMEAVTA